MFKEEIQARHTYQGPVKSFGGAPHEQALAQSLEG